jgi:YHS domain-containing protein
MKHLTATVLLACCLVASASAADAKKAGEKKPKPKTVNATCPVSGDDVDANVTVTQDKKVVGFCCEDCVKAFKKDPAKYMKKVEAEEAKKKKDEKAKGEQPAADKSKPVNQFCPIDREHAVDPTVTTTYKGKVVGFCCEDCIKKFDLDPDAYLADLK